MMIVMGKFDVTLTPEEGLVPGGSVMRLTTQYHGALSGTLDGRAGSFMLQHSGTMRGGRESLSITVVPNSGKDALAGLSGSMAIERHGADHAYRFEYAL